MSSFVIFRLLEHVNYETQVTIMEHKCLVTISRRQCFSAFLTHFIGVRRIRSEYYYYTCLISFCAVEIGYRTAFWNSGQVFIAAAFSHRLCYCSLSSVLCIAAK